jgi:hypothetical protein
MRRRSDIDDSNCDPCADVRPRGNRLFGDLLLIGAAVLLARPAVQGIVRRWRIRNPHAKAESAIDDSLDETFPASDPPAGRYFDIPDNRR